MHSKRIVGSCPAFRNDENGSACSQLIGDTRTFSGKLSGTATKMKNTSRMATAVANATTNETDHLKNNQFIIRLKTTLRTFYFLIFLALFYDYFNHIGICHSRHCQIYIFLGQGNCAHFDNTALGVSVILLLNCIKGHVHCIHCNEVTI